MLFLVTFEEGRRDNWVRRIYDCRYDCFTELTQPGDLTFEIYIKKHWVGQMLLIQSRIHRYTSNTDVYVFLSFSCLHWVNDGFIRSISKLPSGLNKFTFIKKKEIFSMDFDSTISKFFQSFCAFCTFNVKDIPRQK